MWIILMAGEAMAADCAVAPVDVDGQGFADLASGLAAATADARVEICPGTYVGTFVATVPVDLVGLGGSAATTLDGDFMGTVLELAPGSSVTGLTVTDGASLTNGGGIALSGPGLLTVADSEILDNHAEDNGGGIYLPGGSELQISGSRISLNSAKQGGGIALDVGGGGLALGDSVIEGNLALTEEIAPNAFSPGFGAGVFLSQGWITDGEIIGNDALDTTFSPFSFGFAGGVGVGGPVVIERTVIADNQASGGGGLSTAGDTDLVDVLIENNFGRTQGGGVDAGAPFGGTGTVTAYTTVIRGNETFGSGAGIFTFASGSTLRWFGGRVAENFALNSGGGFSMLNGFVELVGVEFHDNVAQFYGGGVGTNFGNPNFPSSLTIDSCDFVGNEAQIFDGGGADIGVGGSIVDSRFFRNRAGNNGGGLTMFGFGFFGDLFGVTQFYDVTDCTFEHNEAAGTAGAMLVETGADCTVDGVVAHDNRAGSGGVIGIVDGVIAITASDFGTCPDNLPDDIAVDTLGVSERYGALNNVVCDDLVGCVPPGTPLNCVNPAAPSCVDPTAQVANQAVLGAGSELRANTRIRDRAELGTTNLLGNGAQIGFDVETGAQTQVCDGARVNDRVALGDDVTVDVGARVGFDVEIGDDAIVGARTVLRDRVTIEAGATLGDDGVVGFDVTVGTGAHLGDNVVLRDRATVGAGAVLGDGVTVAIDATVPAGAVIPAGASVP